MRLSVATKVFLGFAVVIAVSLWTSLSIAQKMDGLRRIALVSWRDLNPEREQLIALARQIQSAEEILKFSQARDLLAAPQVLPAIEPFRGPRGLVSIGRRLEPLLEIPLLHPREKGQLAEIIQKLRSFSEESQSLQVLLTEGQRARVEAAGAVSNEAIYAAILTEVIKELSAGGLSFPSTHTESLGKILRRLQREINEQTRAMRDLMARVDERVDHDALSIRRVSSIVTGLALALSVLILIMLMLTLRPIRKLRLGARQIAGGDYTQRVQVRSQDELGQLAREFNTMARALQTRDETLKSQHDALVRAERLAAVGRLAAKITHEVRNPLSSIGLNAELLEDELEQLSSPLEARALLGSIAQEVDRLREITEAYLQLTRADQQGWDRWVPASSEPLQPLRVWVGEFMRWMAPEAARTGVQAEATVTEGDFGERLTPRVMHQILLNLFRNAFRAVGATEGAEGVKLSVYLSPGGALGEAQIVFEMTDDAAGIPPEIQPQIFEPFVGLDEHGTGLGLAIVRDLVLSLEGEISLKSPVTPLGGSQFTLTFPARVFPPAHHEVS